MNLKGKTAFELQRKTMLSKNKTFTKIIICCLDMQNLFQALFKINLQLQQLIVIVI